jgi:hypothetical protein
MTKGMTAALAAATVTMGLPATTALTEASSLISSGMARGLPAAAVFASTSGAPGVAGPGGSGHVAGVSGITSFVVCMRQPGISGVGKEKINTCAPLKPGRGPNPDHA